MMSEHGLVAQIQQNKVFNGLVDSRHDFVEQWRQEKEGHCHVCIVEWE